ncbi:zinc-binding dehydrogenase [Nonomuraea sp. NN258]|uniref:zinc-binding dehydrogenase n=1 Tax=Nonomuraea antri TaxID=2730852 RepID=UPI0015687CF0|nr:zinc-binding dehydrogenase [Nonomuraea antri]NRQ33112.1 zinc-binding dehydrogenase [Nonomuraea antri]
MTGRRKVTAAVVTAPGGEFSPAEVELDEPRPAEVLVGVEAVGMCHADRLSLARKLGATRALNATRTDVVAGIAGLSGGGADRVLESSGVPAVFRQAVQATATGGMTGVVGAPPFGTTAPLDVADLVNNSRRVVGIVEGRSDPPRFLPAPARLVADGSLPVHELITTYPLRDITAAAAAMAAGTVIKPVLLPGQESS